MISFFKMHGIGNDFVLVDNSTHSIQPSDCPELARTMCDRRFGVGSDGLILLNGIQDGALDMAMFNPDGSQSAMCGNGLRCVARLAHRLGYVNTSGAIRLGGAIRAFRIREDHQVAIDMTGLISTQPGSVFEVESNTIRQLDIPISNVLSVTGFALEVGNPHFVIFCRQNNGGPSLSDIPIESLGPFIEHHAFFPNRTNVHWMELTADGVAMRTWERGAGVTLACGSGAFACAIIAKTMLDVPAPVAVDLPGGRLTIELEPGYQTMIGPATFVFNGEWRPDPKGI